MVLSPKQYSELAKRAPRPHIGSWIQLVTLSEPPSDLKSILQWIPRGPGVYYVEGPQSVIDHMHLDNRFIIF